MSKAGRTAEAIAEVELSQALAEEYASVTVALDHLIHDAHPNGHVVVKDIWSTETAVEAILAQLEYFGDTHLLRNKGTVSMIAGAEGGKAAAFVYIVNDRQTNVIVDAALWTEMLQNMELTKGTVLGTHAALIVLATDMKRAAHAEGREGDRILCFLSE